VAAVFAHFAGGQAAAAEACPGVEFRHLPGRRTERLVMRRLLAQHVARFEVAANRAGVAPPQQNLLRTVAQRAGERFEMIEAKPDQAIFKPRQLLLGNAGEPHQFRTRHAARLARVIEPAAGRGLSASAWHANHCHQIGVERQASKMVT